MFSLVLETKRLLILTINQLPDRTCINAIFLKQDGITGLTAERLGKDSKLLARVQKFPVVGQISTGARGWVDYLILEEHQNKGYATEALKEVKAYTKSFGVTPYLDIDDDNLASKAVAAKAGFSCKSTHKKGEKQVEIWE